MPDHTNHPRTRAETGAMPAVGNKPIRRSRLSVMGAGCLLLVGGLWWLGRPAPSPQVSSPGGAGGLTVPAASSLVSVSRPISEPWTAASPEISKWSRAEALANLQAYFTREQLDRELELEQQRYGREYWQTAPAWAQSRARENRRMQLVGQLQAEANGLFASLFPGETGDAIKLRPFFSADVPGPNLAGLAEDAREGMKDMILAMARGGLLDAGQMMEAAAQILSADELSEYARWNAPKTLALRDRLAGFGADENEFTAILRWQDAFGTEREGGAREELIGRIGPDRLAQFEQQMEPAMRTAMQDLQRYELPLDQADWLTGFRRQAMTQFQQIWEDTRLTDAQKAARVRQEQNASSIELATRLGISVEVAATAELLP